VAVSVNGVRRLLAARQNEAPHFFSKKKKRVGFKSAATLHSLRVKNKIENK
jgi:hypothetical protein